jgi:hypothetical protein
MRPSLSFLLLYATVASAMAFSDGRGLTFSRDSAIAGGASFGITGLAPSPFEDFANTAIVGSSCDGGDADDFAADEDYIDGDSSNGEYCAYTFDVNVTGDVTQSYSLSLGRQELTFNASTLGHFDASWQHECIKIDPESQACCCCPEPEDRMCTACHDEVCAGTGGGSYSDIVVNLPDIYINSPGTLRTYPITPAARNVMYAQARCSMAA